MQRATELPKTQFLELIENPSGPPSLRRVLPTKLRSARQRQDCVPRQHLIDLIQSDPDQQIVVIEAPAGYGKSTLAAQWLEISGLPAAWLSLDSWDNEPAQFFSGIVAALQSIEPGLGESALAQFTRIGPVSDLGIIDALVDDLSAIAYPCALVLDDFHNITDPGLREAAAVLLRNLPPSMRVLILTRSDLALPLSRFRSRGELLEIDTRDLQFSRQEAMEFLGSESQHPLSSPQIIALNNKTEGWVAGLRLAWHMINRDPGRTESIVTDLSARSGPIEDYLWEEVLNDLPPQLTEFLLLTSIFERITPSLCDYVLDANTSARRIEAIDAAGLFLISLDQEGIWSRYHQLFSDVLQHQLHETVPLETVIRLHRRGSVWFEANGWNDEAIRHAVAGEDWARAVSLIEPVARQLQTAEMIGALRSLLDVLPPAVLDVHPELSYLLAWATARSGRVAASLEPLLSAEKAWTAAGDQENLGRVAVLRCLNCTIRSDFDGTLAYADSALSLLPESRIVERAHVINVKATSLLLRGKPGEAGRVVEEFRPVSHDQSALERLYSITKGTIHFLQGDLRDADVFFRHATRPDQHATLIQIQHALGHLGMLQLERNQIEDAEQSFTRSLRLSDEAGTILWRGRSHFGLALVARAHGDSEEALIEADRSVDAFALIDSEQEQRKSRALRGRLWIDAGHISLARRWAEEEPFDPDATETGERYYELATKVRLLLATSDPAGALIVSDLLRDHAVEDGRLGDVIEQDILAALALDALGESERSLIRLRDALSTGEPRGYIRIFADHGDALVPLLRRNISTRGKQRDFTRQLLTIIEGTDSAHQGKQGGVVPLSAREIEVLRLVAAGLSNRAISDRLFITEKTVKKHVSNVLANLEAANRTEAVALGRQLGILDD